MNILSSMPLARQARPALSRRAFFSRAFCSARSVLRRASEARSRSSAARARAASRTSAKADHAPPNMLMPTGVSSTMRSTRSSSARSWLATRTPPCQRSSNCATACRPSASRLLVGSSSSSRSGAAIRRRASARRVRSPPLKETIGRCSGNDGSPASASATCIRVSSVQSASAASSSDPSNDPWPRSSRRSRARPTATPSASSTVNRSSVSCASMPIEPTRCSDPLAGSISPAIRRSNVDLPQPLRPTMPVRSRPKASVNPSNSGRPSGVAREMESRTRKAGMESFRKWTEVAGRGQLCDVHFALQGSR